MTETSPSVTRPKPQRPLSPHLQVYKPQLTSILSITHRITGVALALGLLLLAWWIVALASGPEAFARIRSLSASPPGLLLLIGWTWALFFHTLTGVRHLFWDAGYGFSIEATYRSGWAVVIGSLLLTVITIGLVLS